MADQNTSLPVRTQTNGDIAAKIVDGTTTSQALAIDASGRVTTKLDDGNGNIITSQANGAQRALDVGINVSGVQIDPRSIRALTSSDVVTVDQGTSPWVDNLTQVGGAAIALGQTTMSASLPVTIASNQSALTVNQGTSPWVTSISTALPAGTNIIGKVEITDGTNTAGVTAASTAAVATQPAEVVALSPNSPLPAGTNAIGSVLANIQVGSAAVSNTNPVPVSLTTSSPGLAVQDYHTSVALAAASSVTFTYTVAASHTFNLERVWASASGKIKVVVQNGATNIYTGFNSTANPNIDITVMSPPTIAAAGTVNVIITNDDLLAMDVYCTIEGNQN